jgi:hypothetical protein
MALYPRDARRRSPAKTSMFHFVYRLLRIDQATEWRLVLCLRSVRLVDGTDRSGKLMRRRVGWRWEYRSLTASEFADAVRPVSW